MTRQSDEQFNQEGLVEAYRRRIERTRERMEEVGVDVLLLSYGGDLPWLIGYKAMELERPTLLILPRGEEPTLVVPALEAPRVRRHGELFAIRPWLDSEDALEIVSNILGSFKRGKIALSDRAWVSTLLGLQHRMPEATFSAASPVTSPLRAVKDKLEIEFLRYAGSGRRSGRNVIADRWYFCSWAFRGRRSCRYR